MSAVEVQQKLGALHREQAGMTPNALAAGTVTDPTRAPASATAVKSTERGGCRMSDSLQISAS
ncbi:hypothetical protein AQI84_05120 [Streptomyces griseorubiginosus]|nr:hypothetical protein AQI84_05120 [Streptomyces griseorubiginosus]